MAPKAMKRTLSKAGSSVAKKCKTIAATIRSADDVPAPVRSMLCDTLVRTFGTYKEERHAFQNSAVALVGSVIKNRQAKLQAAIDEANGKKATVDAEAAALSATNDAANAASEAAATALANSKTAVSEAKTALKDANAHLHELEKQVKGAEADATAAAARKEKLEKLNQEYIGPIKEGTQHGVRAGSHVGKGLEASLQAEFVTCVTRTFSKSSSTWGTFDKIVEQRLGEQLKKVLAELEAEMGNLAAAQQTGTADIEAAKTAITAAEEKVKSAEEASTAAAAAAKEASDAAHKAAADLKKQGTQVQKAADVCEEAEADLVAFTKGALAAYTEVEANKAPEPEPAQEEPAAAAAVAEAMASAPPAVERAASRTMLPSPAVLLQSARNLLPSPRQAPAQSPTA